MACVSDAERLQQLRQKKADLQNKVARVTATEKSIERRRLNQRKIIIGAVVVNAMQSDPTLAGKVRELLKASKLRDNERELLADLLTG